MSSFFLVFFDVHGYQLEQEATESDPRFPLQLLRTGRTVDNIKQRRPGKLVIQT